MPPFFTQPNTKGETMRKSELNAKWRNDEHKLNSLRNRSRVIEMKYRELNAKDFAALLESYGIPALWSKKENLRRALAFMERLIVTFVQTSC